MRSFSPSKEFTIISIIIVVFCGFLSFEICYVHEIVLKIISIIITVLIIIILYIRLWKIVLNKNK